jgi:hypothetical protein
MRAIAIGVVLVAAWTASAAPVDPNKLAAIKPAPVAGVGPAAAIWVTDVDADVLLAVLASSVPNGNFAMLSGTDKVTGRLGDREPVTEATAFESIAPAATVRLVRSRGGHAIDLESRAAGPLDVLRLLSDAAGASYVFAPQHALPKITVVAHQVDPRATATVIAKLAGLELAVHGKVWIVTEPGAVLDATTVAKTERQSRIEIDHAHPGEARRLLDPAIPDDQSTCPKETWVEASLHGEVGALEAVLATLEGPACEQQSNLAELDTATAQLVGILVGAKVRRAVFRVPHGARVFQPAGHADLDQRVEIDHVIVHAGRSAALASAAPIKGSVYVAPGPFEAADEATWQLRGIVRVAATWRAIFRSKSEWRVVGAPAEITAGTVRSVVGGKPRGYALER